MFLASKKGTISGTQKGATTTIGRLRPDEALLVEQNKIMLKQFYIFEQDCLSFLCRSIIVKN